MDQSRLDPTISSQWAVTKAVQVDQIIKILEITQISTIIKENIKLLKQFSIYPDLEYRENKIIEFYGDYWHANPNKYQDTHVLYRDITAVEKRTHDSMRIKILEDLGYKVLIIWEEEYYNKPDEILIKCINFLKET